MTRTILLALILAVGGCAAKTMPVKTQVVEVPVEVVREIPAELTRKLPKPSRPANRCRDASGKATICNRDLATWVNEYDALVDKMRAQLDAIIGLSEK